MFALFGTRSGRDGDRPADAGPPPRSWKRRFAYAVGLVAGLSALALPVAYAAGLLWSFAVVETILTRWVFEAELHSPLEAVFYLGVWLLWWDSLLFFLLLLRPFFLVSRDTGPVLRVGRDSQPRLFAFLDRLCDHMAVPRAQRFHFDLEINAGLDVLSARRGELDLQCGLPLFQALTVRQFAGLLAHEMGHFRQRGGLRILARFSELNGKIEAAVLGEDPLLRRLEGRKGWAGRAGLGLVADALAWHIGLATGLLRLAWIPCARLAEAMSRSLEFDADMRQIEVAGSRDFEETMVRMMVLEAAYGMAVTSVETGMERGFRVEDFPALVDAHARRFVSPVRGSLLRRLFEGLEEGLSAEAGSHPSDSQRLRQARLRNAPPGFSIPDAPTFAAAPDLEGCGARITSEDRASLLLDGFENLSRSATDAFYLALGMESTAPAHPVDAFLARREAGMSAEASLHHYFGNLLGDQIPLPLPLPSAEAAAEVEVEVERGDAGGGDAEADWRKACVVIQNEAQQWAQARFHLEEAQDLFLAARKKPGSAASTLGYARVAQEWAEELRPCGEAFAWRLEALGRALDGESGRIPEVAFCRRRFAEAKARFHLLQEARDALWRSGEWPGSWVGVLESQGSAGPGGWPGWTDWLRRWREFDGSGAEWPETLPETLHATGFDGEATAWSLRLATQYADALGEWGYAAGMAEAALGLTLDNIRI